MVFRGIGREVSSPFFYLLQISTADMYKCITFDKKQMNLP